MLWNVIYGQVQDLIPDAPRVVVEITPTIRQAPRDFAEFDFGVRPLKLRLHPDIFCPPIARYRGVLAHEAGHLVSFVLGEEGYRSFCRGVRLEHLNSEELRADQLGEVVTGWHIYYNERDLVQRAGIGARGLEQRPESLPR